MSVQSCLLSIIQNEELPCFNPFHPPHSKKFSGEVNGLNHKDSFFYYCQVLTFKLPVDAADEDENIDYRSHDNKLKLDLESIGSSLKVQ